MPKVRIWIVLALAGLAPLGSLGCQPLSMGLFTPIPVPPWVTERMEETFSGFTAEVAIKMFGDDLDILDRKAREIARVLGGVPGAESVQVQSPLGMPELTIALRKPDLERWGFEPVTVLDVVRTAYQGDVVGQVYPGSKVSDVLVILDAKSRKELKRVKIGRGAAGLQMQPDGSRAYVACTPDDYVVVIDLKSLEIAGRIEAGKQPDGLAWAVRR